MKHEWVKGDCWLTQHRQVYLVTAVRPDGVALLAMVHPYKLTREHSQKPIPEDWVNLGQVDWSDIPGSVKRLMKL